MTSRRALMHPALAITGHRPWALPSRAWIWSQSWRDLLFMHWPVPASELRYHVPEPLVVQEYQGTSWIGMVPFRMCDVARRPLPALPWLSQFPELNLRVYVEMDGKPGVWFLSLDAPSRLAVWYGRCFLHLPYHHGTVRCSRTDRNIRFRATRGASCFEGTYEPTGPVTTATPGTLEYWLTERYCFYAKSPNGVLWRTDVHHAPWPLQAAEVAIQRNTVLDAVGLTVCRNPELVHFAESIDVVAWSPEQVS